MKFGLAFAGSVGTEGASAIERGFDSRRLHQ